MAFGDIQLKLIGADSILEKLNELEKLSKRMRQVVYELDHLGFIRIGENIAKDVNSNPEKE